MGYEIEGNLDVPSRYQSNLKLTLCKHRFLEQPPRPSSYAQVFHSYVWWSLLLYQSYWRTETIWAMISRRIFVNEANRGAGTLGAGTPGNAKGTATQCYRAWNRSKHQSTKTDGAELVAAKIDTLSPPAVILQRAGRPSPPRSHAPTRPDEALHSHPPTLADKIMLLSRQPQARPHGTQRPNSLDRVSAQALVTGPASIEFARAGGLVRKEVFSPRRPSSEEPSRDPKPAVGPTMAQRKRFG